VKRDGVVVSNIAFTSTTGHTVTGVVVRGLGNTPHPGVLFVHWLGDDAETTNHTEFENDAVALAKRGVTSLLIDAMWAQPDWYEKIRGFDSDYANSVAQVIDLRRSLDELLAQPHIDASRVAYVGHDFGSMYGAVLAGVDPRPQWFVLMAGTTTFSEWYLLGPKPPDVNAYTASMEPLDPLPYLSRATARGFFFQFSAHDKYITPEHEFAFYSAAPLPRAMALYNIDHSLRTPAAVSDRLAWLAEKLQL
jgi:fermentation-respiration switch protein FrsA (DUF1100 family)